MKIEDLLEDIGNLAALNAGYLINVLKQQERHSRRKDDFPEIDPVGKKFTNFAIGSTSEIVDGGELKEGLKSLRKFYRTIKDKKSADVHGFGLYINNQAVAVGIFTEHDLAGGSRSGSLAYDLSKFTDVIDQMHQEQVDAARTSWDKQNVQKMAIKTAHEKEPPSWHMTKKPQEYVGVIYTTYMLGEFLDKLKKIADKAGSVITAKFILEDKAAQAKKRTRSDLKIEMMKSAVDLKTRLAIYKNAKKPTVKTIQEFIRNSLANPGKTVQFDGYTYRLTAVDTYAKLEPSKLLAGKPFKAEYKSADPDTYSSLYITYQFDGASRQLLPIAASWTQRTLEDGKTTSQSAVLDKERFLKDALNTSEVDKKSVMQMLISRIKSNTEPYKMLIMIRDLRAAGEDWPELAVLEKTVRNQTKS